MRSLYAKASPSSMRQRYPSHDKCVGEIIFQKALTFQPLEAPSLTVSINVGERYASRELTHPDTCIAAVSDLRNAWSITAPVPSSIGDSARLGCNAWFDYPRPRPELADGRHGGHVCCPFGPTLYRRSVKAAACFCLPPCAVAVTYSFRFTNLKATSLRTKFDSQASAILINQDSNV